MEKEKKEIIEVKHTGIFVCPRCGAELEKGNYDSSNSDDYISVLANVFCPNDDCGFHGYLWHKCMGITETNDDGFEKFIPLDELVEELLQIIKEAEKQ